MKTPWRISEEREEESYKNIILNFSGYTVGEILLDEEAEFIVKAVNSHAQLLEAAKLALVECKIEYDGESKVNPAIIKILETAIKNAEGEK